MKIALVAQHATPLRPQTGPEPDSDDIGLRQLARELAGHSHQVTIYAQKQQPNTPPRARLCGGVRVEHIDTGPVPAIPAYGEQKDAGLFDRVPAFSGPLRSRYERERPDVVHALRWTSGLAALAAARGLRIPVVQEFSPPRVEMLTDAGYIYFAGFAGALGISDRVTFTGKIAHGAMPALLRSAALVVSTCRREPSGMTSLQAMACGRPVIAPPVGGHADAVVDGTTGILVLPDRPSLLAQRIRQLLARPMLLEAYGLAAVDRARSRYSWDRIAAEMLTVYDKAARAARL